MIPKAFRTRTQKIVGQAKDWAVFVGSVLVATFVAPLLAALLPLVLTAWLLYRMARPKVTRAYRNPVCPTCQKNHNEGS